MSETRLHIPPLPVLEWEDFFWSGEVVLSSWAGFQARQGAYGSISGDETSDGLASLNVSCPDESQRSVPSPQQIAAFQFLLVRQADILSAILRSLLKGYPELRTKYAHPPAEAHLMPEVQTPAEFKKLIGLTAVHISAVAKHGFAYLGFELGCTWDEEHGLGILIHQDRVVDIGGADVAFLGWNAERDAQAMP